MYCVLNEDKKVIALHDERRVCEKYAEGIQNSHNLIYEVRKLKHGKKHDLKDLDNFYLVRLGGIYVQQQFYDTCVIADIQAETDVHICKDILMRIYEKDESLDDDERRDIKKAIKVVSRLTQKADEYVPLIKELKSLQDMYSEYMYQMNLY